MAVIALAAFVVIAQHARPIDNERQAIFEPVFAPEHSLGNLPDHALDAGPFGDFAPEAVEEPRRARMLLILTTYHYVVNGNNGLAVARPPLADPIHSITLLGTYEPSGHALARSPLKRHARGLRWARERHARGFDRAG